jgi:hypothetical protein
MTAHSESQPSGSTYYSAPGDSSCIGKTPLKLILVLAANYQDFQAWLLENRLEYISDQYSVRFQYLSSRADLLSYSGRELTLINVPNSGEYSPVFDPVRSRSDGGSVSLPILPTLFKRQSNKSNGSNGLTGNQTNPRPQSPNNSIPGRLGRKQEGLGDH